MRTKPSKNLSEKKKNFVRRRKLQDSAVDDGTPVSADMEEENHILDLGTDTEGPEHPAETTGGDAFDSMTADTSTGET